MSLLLLILLLLPIVLILSAILIGIIKHKTPLGRRYASVYDKSIEEALDQLIPHYPLDLQSSSRHSLKRSKKLLREYLGDTRRAMFHAKDSSPERLKALETLRIATDAFDEIPTLSSSYYGKGDDGILLYLYLGLGVLFYPMSLILPESTEVIQSKVNARRLLINSYLDVTDIDHSLVQKTAETLEALNLQPHTIERDRDIRNVQVAACSLLIHNNKEVPESLSQGIRFER